MTKKKRGNGKPKHKLSQEERERGRKERADDFEVQGDVIRALYEIESSAREAERAAGAKLPKLTPNGWAEAEMREFSGNAHSVKAELNITAERLRRIVGTRKGRSTT